MTRTNTERNPKTKVNETTATAKTDAESEPNKQRPMWPPQPRNDQTQHHMQARPTKTNETAAAEGQPKPTPNADQTN